MSTKLEQDNTLSVSQAAKRLGVSRQHLWSLIRDGGFPARHVYGLWRVEEADVQAVEKGKGPKEAA